MDKEIEEMDSFERMDLYSKQDDGIVKFSELCRELVNKYSEASRCKWYVFQNSLRAPISTSSAMDVMVNPTIIVDPCFYSHMYSKINLRESKSIGDIYVMNTGELMYKHTYTSFNKEFVKYILILRMNNDLHGKIDNKSALKYSIPCIMYTTLHSPFYNNWDKTDRHVFSSVIIGNPCEDIINGVYVMHYDNIDTKIGYSYRLIGMLNYDDDFIINDPWQSAIFIKELMSRKSEVNIDEICNLFIISLTPEECSAIVPDRISEKYIGIDFKDYIKSEKHNDAVDSLPYCFDSLGSVIDYAKKTIENSKKKPQPTGFDTIDYLNGTLKKEPDKVNYVDKMHDEYIKNCNKCEDHVIRVIPAIDCVMYNNPFTVIHWTDNTKTTVKVMESETYDPEKGFAMAVLKKLYGNNDDYYDNIRKYLPDSK